MADNATSPVDIIAGVIYEADECPDIFEAESLELAGDIVEALASAGFSITRASGT
ncbi:hypothetical protein [Nonomuraea sp. NPDC050202]|uniref:hypothetical protein n=1 Tax=Nonomuraea sp. NPDC050202 TaxID=3155035 RepID=UPI0033D2988D